MARNDWKRCGVADCFVQHVCVNAMAGRECVASPREPVKPPPNDAMRLVPPAGGTTPTPIVPGNVDRARQAIVAWLANRQTTYTAGNILSDLGVDILKALEAWSIIEQLRAPEGATVTLICDNPDFGPAPDAAIEVCDDWTQWRVLRFEADNVLEALRAAAKASKDPGFDPGRLPIGVKKARES